MRHLRSHGTNIAQAAPVCAPSTFVYSEMTDHIEDVECSACLGSSYVEHQRLAAKAMARLVSLGARP